MDDFFVVTGLLKGIPRRGWPYRGVVKPKAVTGYMY
jgi:5'-deoxynucleotidase YfbR-like HD superfamily hydrolase